MICYSYMELIRIVSNCCSETEILNVREYVVENLEYYDSCGASTLRRIQLMFLIQGKIIAKS